MFRWGESTALYALLLVPLATALLWYARTVRTRALARFGDPALMHRMTETVHHRARAARAVLLVLALGLLVVALARPQFGTRVETVRREGNDIVVALDVSRSMLAEDVGPNRLERSKIEIQRLIQRLEGDRIGLVAFAGQAFVQSPLTTDYGAARLFLNAMDPDLVPVQGTNLGEALSVALDGFRTKPGMPDTREHRVVVVVTDGEDHEGEIDAAVERARTAGVRIYTVGVGSPDGVPIPEFDERGQRRGFKRDEQGSVVTTRLDEAVLMQISRLTGGRHYRSTPAASELDALVEDLATLGGREIETREITQFDEQFQFALGLAILALIVEALLPRRRVVRPAQPIRSGVAARAIGGIAAAAIAMLVLATPGWAFAQAGRADVEQGNRLYEEGRFAEAHERYLEALRAAPGSPLIRFNDGNALYQNQDYQRALDAYRAAIDSGDPSLLSDAWYNLGNALYREQQLDDSLDAYKQALRLAPGDTDAKHNLERVLEQMQQQEQQPQQQGDGEDDESEPQDGEDQQSEQDQQQQDGQEGDQQQDQQGQDQQGQDEQEQQPDQQDQQEEQEAGEQQQSPAQQGEEDQQEGQQQAPGELTREEAERLLQAIQEDPNEVERTRRAAARGRKPKKDW